METTINLYEESPIAENKEDIQIIPSNEQILIIENYFEFWKNKILEFVSLENNWDGYGAVPVLENIGKIAIPFIASLNGSYIEKITDIFPNTHGTVTIEWENEEKEKLSLEIGENNYSYFIELKNANPEFFNGLGTPTIQNITNDINKIYP